MRVVIFACLLFVWGCGPAPEKTVSVSGTVLKGGKPFTFSAQGLPPGDLGFRLEFLKQEGGKDGEVLPAEFKADSGTFTVSKGKGAGLSVGKYRVTVEKGARGKPDEFKGEFSKAKSPLSLDLGDAASATLEVDLDKKTVTAK